MHVLLDIKMYPKLEHFSHHCFHMNFFPCKCCSPINVIYALHLQIEMQATARIHLHMHTCSLLVKSLFSVFGSVTRTQHTRLLS